MDRIRKFMIFNGHPTTTTVTGRLESGSDLVIIDAIVVLNENGQKVGSKVYGTMLSDRDGLFVEDRESCLILGTADYGLGARNHALRAAMSKVAFDAAIAAVDAAF